MAISNALNLVQTGIITADGAGVFIGSTVTEGGVLIAGANNTVTDTGVLTVGTLLVGDGVTAPTLLPVGTDGQHLEADSVQTEGVKWATPTMHGVPAPVSVNTVTCFSDFIEDVGQGFWKGYTKNFSGVSASVINNLSTGISIGKLTLNDHTANIGPQFIGNGTITISLRILYTSSTPFGGGDKFFFGMKDAPGLSAENEMVGVYFDFDTNATNWQSVTAASGVKTYTDLGVATEDPVNWRVLTSVISNNATQVDFYIDGALLGTHTTNIPATTVQFTTGSQSASLPGHPFIYDWVLYNQVCANDRS